MPSYANFVEERQAGLKIDFHIFCIFLSSSGGKRSGGISREEAAEILKVSKAQRPVARVKPIVKVEESSPAGSNLLGEILGRQKEFLKPTDPSSSNFSSSKKRAIQRNENKEVKMMDPFLFL